MKKRNIEYREFKIRSVDPNNLEDRTITGTAIVFNQPSEVLGIANGKNVREIIDPNAITMDLLMKSDIKFLFNHNETQIPVARWNKGKGTLSIAITPTGVDFSFKAKNNAQGQMLLDAVRSGDIDKCSFAFYTPDNYIVTTVVNNEYVQRVMIIEELYDFSVVTMPAYEQTTVRELPKEEKLLEIEEVTEEVVNEPIAEDNSEAKKRAIELYYYYLDMLFNLK